MGIWSWHREEDEPKKWIVKVYKNVGDMRKAFRQDKELFNLADPSTVINLSEKKIDTENAVITYHHMEMPDTLRGMSFDMAIIYEENQDFEMSVLAPALDFKGGRIIK